MTHRSAESSSEQRDVFRPSLAATLSKVMTPHAEWYDLGSIRDENQAVQHVPNGVEGGRHGRAGARVSAP